MTCEIIRAVPRGPAGSIGPIPRPVWTNDYYLSFEDANGTSMGAPVNLLGPEGPAGASRFFKTRAQAMASVINPALGSIRIDRFSESDPFAPAIYVPGTSGGPEAFQDAGGTFWNITLSLPVINAHWFKRSTDAGDDALMLARFFERVTEGSQWGGGYGGVGIIPGGHEYKLKTSVPITAGAYRRSKIIATGAVFTTQNSIWAFSVAGGGYSGGITLEDFSVNQQNNANAKGAFNILRAGCASIVRPNIACGQAAGSNDNYIAIYIGPSDPDSPGTTSSLWTTVDSPQIYSFTEDKVPEAISLEGDANETRIIGGHIGTAKRAVVIRPGNSPYYFANNVKVRDVSIERCDYGVYCSGVLGEVNTKPEGLKVTGCRFEQVSTAAIALLNMDQAPINLPEFHENTYIGTTVPLYNPGNIPVRSTDIPQSLAGVVEFAANTSRDVTFPINQPSGNYVVALDVPVDTTTQAFWVATKGVDGFRISANPAFTGAVGWSLTRIS